MAQKSKYATKRESGKMMYGPGCCGHKISDEKIAAMKRAAASARRFDSANLGELRSLIATEG